MIKSIPPRIMSDVWRERRAGAGFGLPHAVKFERAGFRVKPVKARSRSASGRVRGPVVDVFNEPAEAMIVIDLGGFRRTEIVLELTPGQALLRAIRGELQFEEPFELPPDVDSEHRREFLINGVLQIVLPKKSA